MIRINDILDKILEYNQEADLEIVEKAYVFSARVHEGQVRLSGEPYLSHPLEVAFILADMQLDVQSVAAGLLHDVVEDTHSTEEEITEIFGLEVSRIVAGVTKLSRVEFKSEKAHQAESIRKMLLAMADDIRVILIKLADRLHNMRTLHYHRKKEKIQKIARETLDIYTPLASRLGIYWIKRELEDTSFYYLSPEDHLLIKTLVAKDITEREEFIESVKSRIIDKMTESGLKCEVMGRYKHYYSIFKKMESQGLDFQDVYDIRAFRIILDTIPQCYAALGLIHSMWKPIDSKIKDYIARPKSNMYQSLHTTVIGPGGQRIEIQIRTNEMDSVANSGIAAHWSYKEGGGEMDENIRKTFEWIQNIVENQKNIKDPDEFMENVRLDLFPDEVYVFTPRGEIKALPKGATPIDMAYLIHSEVGHHCTGAKVDGKMVPLKYELKTGEVVEIITSNAHRPSKDWLKFVKTVKARSRIRHWIKSQEKERSITLGRDLCEKEFRKYKLNYNTLSKTDEMNEIMEQFGFKSLDDLIAAIGYGKITPLQIIRKLQAKEEAEEEAPDKGLPSKSGDEKRHKNESGVVVSGLDDILIRFGRCCQPVPGDPIVGYITRGHGVTVHRNNCINVVNMINSDRMVDVQWEENTTSAYPVRIQIMSRDRVGLLADVTANISKNSANIIDVDSRVRGNEIVYSYFTLAVKDTEHLNKVLSDIKKVNFILDARRVKL